jgi:hypothetical protein
MPTLAALAATASSETPTALQRLREIPADFWWRIALIVGLLIGAVVLARRIAKVDKVFLTVGVFLFATIIGFNWVYERNEPRWASPAVQWLAMFFPTKGKV